jgi:hypothetical protein
MPSSKTQKPTPQEFEELLAFLPVFSAPDFQAVTRWHGGKAQDGSMTFLRPEYRPEVDRFVQVAAKPCWQDQHYVAKEPGPILADAAAVKKAGLDQVRSMLTYSVRGERFCTGHLEAMIDGGYLTRLLQRLKEIAEDKG